ncbi:MAG: hypothetical protein CVU46_01640 [Chloroflexi bacterium HGW-Chloroflexi-8]|nr:MAG: hypothetical protein CVU46_01640 [Chloroflexi bacterium HGW-Chloroflexi-8]
MLNKNQLKLLIRMIWIMLFILALVLLYFGFRPNPINFQIVPISPFESSAFIPLSSELIGL